MILSALKSQLQRHGLWAKKSLGQNFLVDENALQSIVAAAELKPTDHVVEVGAGTGLLTTRLAPVCATVTALEYDAELIPVLKEATAKFKNVSVLHQDALRFDPQLEPQQEPQSGYKLVANIPYYITSPLIKHFLMAESQPEVIVLLIQKEVAEKVCANKGKTVLTVEVSVFGEAELVGVVSAKSFHPSPKVDSAILRIRVFKEPKIDRELLPNFLKVVHAGFSQKRKKLSNSLAAGLHIKIDDARELLKKLNFDENIRAENLSIAEWERLTLRITSGST